MAKRAITSFPRLTKEPWKRVTRAMACRVMTNDGLWALAGDCISKNEDVAGFMENPLLGDVRKAATGVNIFVVSRR